MEDAIIISDEEEEEPRGAQLQTERSRCDIIDLTNNHYALDYLPELDRNIIDLTANEDGLGLSSASSPFQDEVSNSGNSSVSNWLCGNSSSETSENEWTSGCSRASDCDTTSVESRVLQSDVSTSRKGKESLADETTKKDKCFTQESYQALTDAASSLQEWSPLPTPASGENRLDFATTLPDVNFQSPSNGNTISSLHSTKQSHTQSSHINKALFYKLRRFKKPPVGHYLHGLEKPQKRGPTKLIPYSRMSLVNNTVEEGMHQGTLHFLSDFVTAEHYPPKDIVVHVIHSILLGAEEEALKNEAYMVLMKVQKLHPADVNTVAWNWSVLSEVLESKDNRTCHLFFQYVVQTLDDDFEIHLLRRSFKKSLCKTVLSCDNANIKNVIAWLIRAVENACDADNRELNAHLQYEQRLVFLLQRMLSIAVEVDNLPVINSTRIADLLFPYVIVLKTRQHRELFFSSTENHLLRAKLLELIFLNSCDTLSPPHLPLSLRKILHFVSSSPMLLENQGPEWQRWDEFLHLICLLFFSLQRIITEHLRTPITDRTDEILQRRPIHFPFDEDVTEAEVEQCMSLFWQRSALVDVSEDLQSQFHMLKNLLLLAIKRPIP